MAIQQFQTTVRSNLVDREMNVVGILGSPLYATLTGTSDVNVTNSILITPAPVVNIGQITVPSTANGILIIAANSKRRKLKIINTGTTVVYLYKDNTVSSSNGMYIPGIAGYPFSLTYNGTIYGIAASGSQVITYWEEADT